MRATVLSTSLCRIRVIVRGWGRASLMLKFRIVVRFKVSLPGKVSEKSLASFV